MTLFYYYYWKIVYNTIQDFSLWIRIGSNQADINQFRSHTGIILIFSPTDLAENKTYMKWNNYWDQLILNGLIPLLALISFNIK